MQQRTAHKAYSQATHTVPKTRQIVMLYDGVIRNLQQACDAMQENRIEDRFNRLVKASEILIGMQMSLDFDQGGEAARALYDFYSYIDSRLMNLHRSNDVQTCRQIIDELKEMRKLWDKIDRGEVAQDGQVMVEDADFDQMKQVAGRTMTQTATPVAGLEGVDASALLGQDGPSDSDDASPNVAFSA